MVVSIIIAAYNSADAVGMTVRAAREIGGVSEVIAVDDGSCDGTAQAARDAGADQVIVLPRNRGKGAAMAAGVVAARGHTVLFLDADLADSAALAKPLLDAVAGRAAMSVAVFPKLPGGGGLGIARGLAAAAIRLLAGVEVTAPLSGQRAMPRTIVERLGLASRFGVETALTAEAAHLGIPVVEVPLPMEHARTDRTIAGFAHRARQFKDILKYALLAGYGLGWPALRPAQALLRVALWLAALALPVALTAIFVPSVAVLAAAAALCGVIAWLPCLWVSAIGLRLRKPNYLGRSLPAAGGLVLPVIGIPFVWFSGLGPHLRMAAVVVVFVFGAVGLLDDLYASRRQARGLRGHLRALLAGRLTTGAVKAIAGLAAGAAAGALLSPGQPAIIILDALLVALSANLINLLDLRPGRALKGFALICAFCLFLAPDSLRLLAPVLALAVVAAPADFAGRVMLGDVGANVLGGAVGLGLAVALAPWQRLVAIVLLAAFHLACERVSFSELVQRSRVLAWLDRVGTGHLAPLPACEAGQ